MAGSITQWIHSLRAGEEEPVHKLWNRWYQRLCSRIAPETRPLSICDEEDIANAAIFDLCKSLKQQKFPDIEDREELWRLLSIIALRKTRDWKKYECRDRRGGDRRTWSSSALEKFDVPDDSLRPALMMQLEEDFQRTLDRLGDDDLKQVALLKLQGYLNSEVAEQMDCSRRRVQYMLKDIKKIWGSGQMEKE